MNGGGELLLNNERKNPCAAADSHDVADVAPDAGADDATGAGAGAGDAALENNPESPPNGLSLG